MRKMLPVLVTAALATPAAADDRFNLGYNALEVASNQDTLRTRFLGNVDFDTGHFQIGWHGLNEVNNFKGGSYFGQNVFTVGDDTQGALVLVATADGVSREYGVRNTSLPKTLGGYGFVLATADTDGVTFRTFYGRERGRFSGEVFQKARYQEGEKPVYYTELQGNVKIADNLSMFGRAELSGFNLDGATYLGGFAVSLK